jgi:hypothetical protein
MSVTLRVTYNITHGGEGVLRKGSLHETTTRNANVWLLSLAYLQVGLHVVCKHSAVCSEEIKLLLYFIVTALFPSRPWENKGRRVGSH